MKIFHLAPNHFCSIILCKSLHSVCENILEKNILINFIGNTIFPKHNYQLSIIIDLKHERDLLSLSVFNHWHWFNNYGFNDSSSTTSKIIIAIAIIIIFKLPSVKASHHRLQEIIRAERQRGQNNLNQSPDFCQSWWCWWWWWWWRWWRWFWWWCWWWCSVM